MASRTLIATTLVMLTLCAAPASAEAPLRLELNRLEAAANQACRIWMVLENDAPDAVAIGTHRLDLVSFGTDDQIARRAAVEIAPVGAGGTAMRLFDLAELDCATIGRVLVNDVLPAGSAAPRPRIALIGCVRPAAPASASDFKESAQHG